jgi:hypothetical protein
MTVDLLLGVEQEHELFDGRRRLDFQSLFASAIARTPSIPFRNDDHATVLDAGYVLACDGWDAELATVPIPASGDGCLALAREVLRCRQHLLGLLRGLGVPDVHGYSTHLNISVPLGREEEVAHALARSIGPALILLMESRTSPGLLLRPRRGRVEVGSEYIDQERRLAAACVLLSGAVHAYLFRPETWELFPQVVLARWDEAIIRPGIFLPHDAYGESIYDRGRSARLELESGESATAGDLLASCLALALEGLGDEVSEPAAEVLRSVAGSPLDLPIEQGESADPGMIVETRGPLSEVPEAGILKTLSRAGMGPAVAPRFVDWEGAAFSWVGPSGTPLIIAVPWQGLHPFFAAARAEGIQGFVAGLGTPQPELSSLSQLRSAGTYQAVDPVALGRETQAGKRGDRKREPAAPLRVAPSGRRWLPWLLIGLITLVVALITCEEIVRRVVFPRTPTPTPTRIVAATRRAKPSATATRTATPTVTPTPTPTSTPTETPSPTPTQRRPRPTRTEPPQEPPTACTPGLPCP